jgi:hypothetical protein
MKDVTEALSLIARAISAIDHNLEVLVARMGADSAAVAVPAALLEVKPK